LWLRKKRRARSTLKSRVRRANESDIDQIVNVINTTNKALYKGVIPSENFRDPFITRRQLADDFRTWHFFVYENEQRIIGTVALEESNSKTGTVYRLYVLPQFQRRGVASALMRKVEHKAKELGLKRLRLRVMVKAHWAISFYRKMGYSKVGEIDYQWGRDHVLQKNL